MGVWEERLENIRRRNAAEQAAAQSPVAKAQASIASGIAKPADGKRFNLEYFRAQPLRQVTDNLKRARR